MDTPIDEILRNAIRTPNLAYVCNLVWERSGYICKLFRIFIIKFLHQLIVVIDYIKKIERQLSPSIFSSQVLSCKPYIFFLITEI